MTLRPRDARRSDMAITSANQLELLQTARAVAQEKMIEPELVIEAMEEAFVRAAKSQFGMEMDSRVTIDRDTGKATFKRVRTVVEDGEMENYHAELTVEQAMQYLDDPKVGDAFVEEIPPVEMGRINAQPAKQVILQKVREAERDRTYEEFKDQTGKIISGVVKSIEYGNVIVDVGRGDAILRRNERIQPCSLSRNERVRCYVKDVRRENRGPQIFLSRTAPEFMAELFKMQVPEIYHGTIEIKSVARDPGSRAKIAVFSHDNSIDPVGACVGMRGNRVQAVVSELQGEKIDIIPWSEEDPAFVMSALQPAEIIHIVWDEERNRVELVVAEDQLSLAIGRRGQNVRLASQLTGLEIDIIPESHFSERRQKEYEEHRKLFMDNLDIDEFLAQLLVSVGFTTLDEVAFAEIDEFLSIEGIDNDTANELQARALDVLDARADEMRARARALGVEESLIDFEGLDPEMILALAQEDILTLEQFATCADWELAGGWTSSDGERVKDEGILESFDVSLKEARYLVVSARVKMGWMDPGELEKLEVEELEDHEENTADLQLEEQEA